MWIEKSHYNSIIPLHEAPTKIIGGYVSRKPNIRRKMKILNDLLVPKSVKGVLQDFETSKISVAKYQKNEGALET